MVAQLPQNTFSWRKKSLTTTNENKSSNARKININFQSSVIELETYFAIRQHC